MIHSLSGKKSAIPYGTKSQVDLPGDTFFCKMVIAESNILNQLLAC